MKYIKTYENKNLKYNIGDYIIPIETEYGKNPKDSYSVIVSILRGGSFGEYMISTYNIYTDKKLEGPWPIFDSEIVRKLTPDEIQEITIKKDIKKYNL